MSLFSPDNPTPAPVDTATTETMPIVIAIFVAIVTPAAKDVIPAIIPAVFPAVKPAADDVAIAVEALATVPAAFDAALTAIVCITCKLQYKTIYGINKESQASCWPLIFLTTA